MSTLSSLFDQIREDYIAHDRDWTRAGFKALLIHRFGVWRMTLPRSPLRWFLGIVYRILYRRANSRYGITIPYSASIGRRVVFHHDGITVVSGYCSIGDDCIFRHGVTLGVRHGPDDCPTIGNRVEFGVGAVVLGRISIGDDCVIGANAVVLKDMPPFSVAVGIPARITPRRKPADPAETRGRPTLSDTFAED